MSIDMHREIASWDEKGGRSSGQQKSGEGFKQEDWSGDGGVEMLRYQTK
jgi:hypothetical protein